MFTLVDECLRFGQARKLVKTRRLKHWAGGARMAGLKYCLSWTYESSRESILKLKILVLIGILFVGSGVAVFLSLPKSTHLRGNAVVSPDGKTYLVIVDTDRLNCKVDKKEWPYRPGEKGAIPSGTHSVECSGHEIGFDIPAGSIFYLDYWGP